MRTIPTGVQTHLEGESLDIATLWKITRRDGQVFTFTDLDRDVVFSGLTYDAAVGYNRTASADSSQLSPSNLEIEAVLDSSLITEADLLAGRWDYAQVEMRKVVWTALLPYRITAITKANPGVVTAPGHKLIDGQSVTIHNVAGMTQVNGVTYTATVLSADTFSIGVNTSAYTTYTNSGYVQDAGTSWDLRKGRIGQVSVNGYTFRSELLGQGKALEQNLLRPYLPGCPAALGDTECAVNLAAFTFSGTIGIVDSSGLTLSDAGRLEASAYFDYGLITMTSGLSSGYDMEIKSYTPGVMVLQQPLPFGVAVGDTYSIRAGCDKRKATCIAKFNNVVNFRGFPDMPGMDKVLSYGK